jgi:hypothetical protein
MIAASTGTAPATAPTPVTRPNPVVTTNSAPTTTTTLAATPVAPASASTDSQTHCVRRPRQRPAVPDDSVTGRPISKLAAQPPIRSDPRSAAGVPQNMCPRTTRPGCHPYNAGTGAFARSSVWRSSEPVVLRAARPALRNWCQCCRCGLSAGMIDWLAWMACTTWVACRASVR